MTTTTQEFSYEGVRRIVYDEGACFVPRCIKCGRFVRPDQTIMVSNSRGLKDQPNATCKHCGRTKMLFEGFL